MQYVSIYDKMGIITEFIKNMEFWKEREDFFLHEEILKNETHLFDRLQDIRPDILIMSISSNDIAFFQTMREINKTFTDIHMIVIGCDGTYENVRESFLNGAFDYLVQPCDLDMLKESMLRVYSEFGIEYVLEKLRLKSDALIDNIFQGGGQEEYIIKSMIDQIYEDWKNDAINCQSVADKAKKRIYEILIERKPWLEKFLYSKDFAYHYGFVIKTKEQITDEWFRCFREASAMVTKYQMIDDKLVYNIGKYVVVHVDEKLSLEKVAKGVFLNPSYVSHIFKATTGMSFINYLAEVKVDRAKVLLRDKNIRICDVANIVGYNNPEYFAKNFKKKTGYTPINYKAELQKNENERGGKTA
ncbi:MAG: helix-turn-helix domain-containing protein [Hespellia sp.]|nr:helix-turn-helix domain-containing protein [Hespellia sp.]